jgi:phage terminase large subunit-like protein
MLESGNWYLPHPQLAPWVQHFINECASFPKGSYDDCVDFWSMSAARLLNNAPTEDEDDAVNQRIRGYKEAGWTA